MQDKSILKGQIFSYLSDPKISDIYTHFSHKLGLIRNLVFYKKNLQPSFLLTFQAFEFELQFVARYFSLWILRTRHS